MRFPNSILPFIAILPLALSLPQSGALGVASLKASSCSTSRIAVPLPSNQTTLSVPSGQKTTIVTVGRGVQNYTCTSGAWVSVGALANLYDASCLFNTFDSATLATELPEFAFQSLSYPDKSGLPVKLHHFFVNTPNATSGVSPEFASTTDHAVYSKTASLASPANATADVPWLQLTAISGQGTLSKTAFRLNTVGGQPPATCSTEGEQLSVQYAANYFFTA